MNETTELLVHKENGLILFCRVSCQMVWSCSAV